MDTNFVDLNILLTRVRNPRSKTYLLEAIRSYNAGALRSALSAVWVAVAYDLIAKYRELSAQGDAAAAAFLQTWDTATAKGDVKRLLQLERSLLADATTVTQIVDRLSARDLQRLHDDRHLCAHPAFSTEADLFEPSPELVRLHLVNAIHSVLSQQPLQGKAILDQFGADVQTPGFPSSPAKIYDYVEQRYIARMRPQNIRNFGIVLTKALLKNVPPEWDTYRPKIVASFVAIRERAPDSWPDVSGAALSLVNSLEPPDRLRALTFISDLPDLWPLLENPTRTALSETLANTDPAQLADFRVLSAVRLPEFTDRVSNIIAALTEDQLRDAVAVQPLRELWDRAVEIYQNSGSYRGSEANFRDFITPFSGMLNSSQIDDVLMAIVDNGQNFAAAETPQLLLGLLKNTAPTDLPQHDDRSHFCSELRRFHQLDRYDEVFALLSADGWTPPQVPPPED